MQLLVYQSLPCSFSPADWLALPASFLVQGGSESCSGQWDCWECPGKCFPDKRGQIHLASLFLSFSLETGILVGRGKTTQRAGDHRQERKGERVTWKQVADLFSHLPAWECGSCQDSLSPAPSIPLGSPLIFFLSPPLGIHLITDFLHCRLRPNPCPIAEKSWLASLHIWGCFLFLFLLW